MTLEIATPAQSLWNQRQAMQKLLPAFRSLQDAIGYPGDMAIWQWVHLAAYAVEYQPDLIIELGRGAGNSTACFLEAINHMGGADNCKLLSLCRQAHWRKISKKRIRKSFAPLKAWFEPAIIEETDITQYDLKPHLEGVNRCLVLWDAHGFEVASWVLTDLMPLVSARSHRIIMHDLSDSRYDVLSGDYGDQSLWTGENKTGVEAGSNEEFVFLGNIYTKVSQSLSAVDFTTRNNIPLHSATHSFVTEIGDSANKMGELKSLLGDEASRLDAHWFWFSLEEAKRPYCFPGRTCHAPEGTLERDSADTTVDRPPDAEFDPQCTLGKSQLIVDLPTATVTQAQSPASTLWNQRYTVQELLPAFRTLRRIINSPGDLFLHQWVELAAVVLDYEPDLIIELGRGDGNTTACFLEAINRLGGHQKCQLLSLCRQPNWREQTRGRIEQSFAPSDDWFAPGIIEETEITDFDIKPHLNGASRCLVFWDAHGTEVAEWVLSELMPPLSSRSHRVIMHDLSDSRYDTVVCDRDYGGLGIWTTSNKDGVESGSNEERVFLGPIVSKVSQSIAAIDFTTRNNIELHSASESYFTEIGDSKERLNELRTILGVDASRLDAHWFWFTLEDAADPFYFPKSTRSEIPHDINFRPSDSASKNRQVSGSDRKLVGTTNQMDSVPAPGIRTSAEVLWSERQTIHQLLPKFRTLSKIVNEPHELELYQWIQLSAMALDYKPQLIIEIGRGAGNSTACFLEVINSLGGTESCKLLSLGSDSRWRKGTRDRIQKTYAPSNEWFAPGIIEETGIMEYDFLPQLAGVDRCLVFWSADGFEVADCVLGELLPALEDCSHRILMHNMSDARFEECNLDYNGLSLWNPKHATPEQPVFLGHVCATVARSMSVVDFANRNNIPLHSASESFHSEIQEFASKLAELRSLFGEDATRMDAHWFWFTLEQGRKPIRFPGSQRSKSTAGIPWWIRSVDSISEREVRNTPSAIKLDLKKRFKEFQIKAS